MQLYIAVNKAMMIPQCSVAAGSGRVESQKFGRRRCINSYSEVYLVYIRGPPIQNFGDGTDLKVGTTNKRPRGRGDTATLAIRCTLLYARGLTRSIAYHPNCLVNMQTAIIVKMTLHIGII